MAAIEFYNRATQRFEVEKVYGESATRFAYENPLGKLLTDHVLTKAWFSKVYGATQSTGFSAKKIPEFIKKFEISMHEFQSPDGRGGGFASFNDFFIRPFKQGVRKFVDDPKQMAAPCEARYFGWAAMTNDVKYPVKGSDLTAAGLLGVAAKSHFAESFNGGPLLIARLCPVDYHRFHYPDRGTTLEQYAVHGRYDSVNPVALAKRSEIFIENERAVAILETQNFGKLAYIEVGALCVGKIVQTHTQVAGSRFERGDEKGYFLFGGSTVIVIGEPGRWTPSADILTHTANQREVLVRLGEPVAQRAS